MNLPISLEFFPTKTPEGAEKLRAARQQLYALKPEFCSVTFGAGGSTQDGTFAAVTGARVDLDFVNKHGDKSKRGEACDLASAVVGK